jgi:uncharacterized protein (DUF1778 family)
MYKRPKGSEELPRIPIRFDCSEQIDLIRAAADKIHWSFNRFAVVSMTEVAKTILAAARAEEEALSQKVAAFEEVESKQPTA